MKLFSIFFILGTLVITNGPTVQQKRKTAVAFQRSTKTGPEIRKPKVKFGVKQRATVSFSTYGNALIRGFKLIGHAQEEYRVDRKNVKIIDVEPGEYTFVIMGETYNMDQRGKPVNSEIKATLIYLE